MNRNRVRENKKNENWKIGKSGKIANAMEL